MHNNSSTPVTLPVNQNPHARFVVDTATPVGHLTHKHGFIRFFIASDEFGERRLYAEVNGFLTDEAKDFLDLLSARSTDLFADISECDRLPHLTRDHHVRRHANGG